MSTASSAATSTSPRSTAISASATATAATGWKAAPRSASTPTGISRLSPGRRSRRTGSPKKRTRPSRSGPPDSRSTGAATHGGDADQAVRHLYAGRVSPPAQRCQPARSSRGLSARPLRPCGALSAGSTLGAMSDRPEQPLPTAADVDAAAARLRGIALRTPLIASPVLDAVTGGRVFLKAETLQRTGSFQFRGAYNKLSVLPEGGRAGGVVAFSSGNHAQGVAAAAQLLSIPAVIVMPSDAPRPKRERTAQLGAEVVLYDRARDDREAIARGIAEQRHAVLVPPYDDPLIIAGQGTTGREIVEDLAALGLAPDVVIVNASGGGLTAGVALAVKARVPAAQVVTAEP